MCPESKGPEPEPESGGVEDDPVSEGGPVRPRLGGLHVLQVSEVSGDIHVHIVDLNKQAFKLRWCVLDGASSYIVGHPESSLICCVLRFPDFSDPACFCTVSVFFGVS